MKKLLFTLLIALSTLAGAISLASCEKDPVKPKNENHDHLHDEPVKMSVELVECHLHADWDKISQHAGPHANPNTPAKYLKRRQVMTYLYTKEGWRLSKDSQRKFYVQKSEGYKIGKKFTPAPVYLLFISYYNHEGELMNGQFATGGQENIHQHFFRVEDVHPTFDGEEETGDGVTTNQIDYIYTDTSPWDKTHHFDNAKLIGDENPIGLKGVIRFLRDRKEMNLRISLYHGFEGKQDPKTNEFSPWHSPSARLLQRGEWDVNVLFPVTVFWSRNEYVDIDDDVDPKTIEEDSLDDESNRTIHSIMHTFGINWTDAVVDWFKYTYLAEGMESSQTWL